MSKATRATIKNAFSALGRRVAFCTRRSLAEVEADLIELHIKGELSERVFDLYLKNFGYEPSDRLPKARSILVLASPIGRSVIELETKAGKVAAIIPPTYGVHELVADNEALLAQVLAAAGSGYERARVPLKSLAARTGLGRYGRDNVLRFEGAGSFVRLDAWWTEIDAEGEEWGPAMQLPRCASCRACERACPNGCFVSGRFLVDASRCLTFLNEGDAAFPEWVDPKAHNAAVGCLRCQDACPENRGVAGAEVYRRFVLCRAESDALLEGREMPDSTALADVLRAAEMTGESAKFARNLRSLIAAQEQGPTDPSGASAPRRA